MHLSRKQFVDLPNKAITLLGMSGVGRTTLADKLPKDSWFHYSAHISGSPALWIRHWSRVRPSDYELTIEVALVPVLGLAPYESFG